MLHRPERRKGLAEELVLRCVEHRHALPVTSNLTESGLDLLMRTHRIAVERALEAGLDVPSKVRDLYPNLKR
jgi:hypothetical protein